MAQANWTSLGSLPTGDSNWAPQVVQSIDLHLEVFTLDGTGGLWHTWQSAPNGTWNPWALVAQPPNNQLVGSLEANSNADGRLEAFTLDGTGGLWHSWQTSPGAGWSQWASLGNLFAGAMHQPVMFKVGRNVDGRLELFTFGKDMALWHSWQTSSGGEWSTWASLGTPRQDGTSIGLSGILAVGQNTGDRLEVFSFSFDGQGAFWHIGQTSPGAGWSQWASLGNPFARAPLDLFQFSVANNVAGRLELFVPSPDGVLHSWQTSPGGEWSTWASLGTPPNRQMGKGPVVGTNANERLEVLSFDSQGALWHIWQQSSGGGWSSWTQFETPSDFSEQWDIATGQDADGHLVIFCRDTNGVLWYTS